MKKHKFDITLDVRVVERNITAQILEQKEYDKYLKGLDDLADQAIPIVIEDEGEPEDTETAESAQTEEPAESE